MSVVVAIAAGALVPVGTSAVAAQTSQAARGVVVVANGWSPPDVGAAAPLAGRLDAAVLYAPKDELGQPTIDALEELNPSRVLLMGGTAALTSAVESGVRSALPGVTVERFSGDDRIDTAARAALSEPAVPAGRPVVIANGWSPPDVGTAAPVAAQLGGSVLYADRGELGAPTAAALRRLVPSRVVIVGGLAAVSADIETEITSVVPGAVIERLSGTDRVDTAALSIDLAGVSLGGPVVLANGWSAPDVGIAAPLAGVLGGSVLLTERSKLGERTAEALEDFSPSQIILIGGTERLAAAVDADLERLHPGIPRVNIAGADRTATAALAALFGVQFSAEQQRFEEAVATITPGEADCDAAPQLDVAGIDVVDPPADLNDPTTPVTVAEVVRIAGGCALVDYVSLNGRTVADIRDLLADRTDVFAVAEPLRGVEPLHDTRSKAHHWFGPNSAVHEHHNDGAGAQWHLPTKYMREELWRGWDDANPIAVAVIDSGTDATHPDLRGRVEAAGLSDCHVTDSWDTDPALNNGRRLSPGGHGTHVAGIIAAGADNGGVAGVAPEATIIPVNIWADWKWPGGLAPLKDQGVRNCRHRALRPDAVGVLEDRIPEAVAHAVNAGARVINMSFGTSFTKRPQDDTCGGVDRGADRFRTEDIPIVKEGVERLLGRVLDPTHCDAFRLVLEIAEAKGVVNVASAGNCGQSCDAYDPETWMGKRDFRNAFNLPAGYGDSVIAVAAVDMDGDRAEFSTARSYVDIAAPGVAILSTLPRAKPGEYDYAAWDGTSMAAPFISGVVAHMLNRHPDAQPWQVRRALADTARLPGWSASWLDPNRARKQLEYGHGIVQPREAILRLGELMDLNRAANQIDDIQVTGHACPIGDETPSCADPAPLSLQPKFAANAYPSRRKYTVEVPQDVDHVSVDIEYSSNGRPGGMLFNPADADFQTAGHQVRFPRNRDTVLLRIWLPTWNGDPTRVPYEFTFIRAEDSSQATNNDPALGSVAFDAGGYHTCGLRPNGDAECWGWNNEGQASPPNGAFAAITAGLHHTCGLRRNGDAECWGWNSQGQASPPNGKFTAISAGDNHTCGIRTNGSAECWGENNDEQSDMPSGVFTAISAGGTHTCGLRRNGTAECWGSNRWHISDAPSGAFTAISAGHWHSCGLRVDGRPECWGENGVGDASPPGGEFTAITAGGGHSCGLRPDGSAECWGRNEYGQVNPSRASGPRQRGQVRPPRSEFIALTAGFFHVCALRTDGSVQCWGRNDHSQSDPPSGQFRTKP
ncbi:MAG: S8 family serine peptidase [Acidimicrobiaceae bacterium]|nr:S8 family serine peptidase [Acidimicrobiaceae bacterium]MDE0497218.1 S8 family serine peptidase [Acidimicrobiaceae bacterium]